MARAKTPRRTVPQVDALAATRFSAPTAPVSRANPLVFISHDFT